MLMTGQKSIPTIDTRRTPEFKAKQGRIPLRKHGR